MMQKKLVLSLLLPFTLAACNPAHEETMSLLHPVEIQDNDACHLCGMIIENFPGPKGEIATPFKQQQRTVKFCSTRDLFAYLLQPENQSAKKQVFVHDMSQAPAWNLADDNAFIDATSAWFVVGHTLRGAMGPTFASFSSQETAQSFVSANSGRIIRFSDVTLELLNSMQ